MDTPPHDGLCLAGNLPARKARLIRPGMAATLALAALLAAGCDQIADIRPAQIRRLHDEEPLRGQKEISVTAKLGAGTLTLDQADAGQLYSLDTEWDSANMSRTVRCETTGSVATWPPLPRFEPPYTPASVFSSSRYSPGSGTPTT